MKKNKNKILLWHIIIATIVFLIGIIFDKIIKTESQLIIIIIYVVAYLILAYKPIYKSIRSISHGKIFDENFLMIIASMGAFIIGEYFESVMVMILYQIGELFENYAVGKSRKSISKLMDIRPDEATIIKDNGEEEIIDPILVEIGTNIIVKVGEKVPLDGVIIKGNTSLNTAALTGESLPKEVFEGDYIESGTINLSKPIIIKTTKDFGESTVSKILELVENASNKKAKTENFITKFAKYYTPSVVILALIIGIIPSIITKDYSIWIYKALNFLVISCPCALVISVPLSFFGGIGGASKQGILIKGSNYFEKLSKANIFVFDKTGTLTQGKFGVENYYSVNEEELFEAAYLAEKNSNHPIAKSIMEFLQNKNYSCKISYHTEEISGMGIVVKGDNHQYLVGNKKMMNEYQIEFTNDIKELGTIIYVAKDNKYLGHFEIVDKIKEDSFELIKELNKIGKKTIMLTGDNEEVAKKVSTSLGLTDYYANLLPKDKVDILEEIIEKKAKNDIVVYVGDGINDAPVLMRADIGISMGKIGSDSAIEASDVVLMFDRLENIIDAKKIANKTLKIAKENIIFALLVKLIILVYSIFFIPHMGLAIFSDVGVSVIAIFNAMRAMKYNRIHKK